MASHSKNVIDHESLGLRWLVCAGTVAVLFVFFLVCIDDKLTNSTSEAVHTKQMREMRGSQASLDSRVTDQRLLVTVGNGSVDSDITHEEPADHGDH